MGYHTTSLVALLHDTQMGLSVAGGISENVVLTYLQCLLNDNYIFTLKSFWCFVQSTLNVLY